MAAKRIRQLVVACALVAVGALAAGSPAYGKGCAGNVKGDPSSSVAQYVEQLPTSCGNHPTGTGNRTTKLPRSIEQKIQSQGGPDAALLQNIATSERYGAPQKKIKSPKAHSGKRHRSILTDSANKTSNPVFASVRVVTSGSDSRLIALVLLMVGIAALVLAAAVRRRRVTH
jgi:hypothetical protein